MARMFERMDQLLSVVLIIGFLALATFVWSKRRKLTENPSLAFFIGMFICAIGSLIALAFPSAFELQRLYASALLIGLGLVLMNVALSTGNPRERLEKKQARLEHRLARQEAANDNRFEELANVRGEQRMAELHRVLKTEQLSNEVHEGVEREIDTREKIKALRARIDRLI